jgi:hypothetical protein
VHRLPPTAQVGRDGLVGLVDRGLARIEVVAVVDDGPRLRKLCLQTLRVRILNFSVGWPAAEKTRRSRAGDRDPTDQNGEPSPHEGDAIVSPATCPVSRRPRSRAARQTRPTIPDRRRPEGT